ncbi:hypothetical protein L6R29_26065 [Myxococcota bacterium]|nr:hypothetical protein [Myxococcota bacterium]
MITILVVVEAEADFRIASVLADRVFQEKAEPWVADNLGDLREWFGFLPESAFVCWKALHSVEGEMFEGKIPRMLGHLNGEALGSDGVLARRVLQMAKLAAQKTPSLKGILLMKDVDTHNQAKKQRDALERVRQSEEGAFAVVLGLANPKREAWVLNGFVLESEEEKAKHAELKKQLGFDPCTEAHRLRTVSHSNTKEQARDVKNVLEGLTGGEFAREERCWVATELAHLRECGSETGLTMFLEELEKRFVLLLGERCVIEG